MSGPVTLQRETFELSRAMEFFSERELTAQIGHSRSYWPVALLKELLDNALDACETASLAPVLHGTVQHREQWRVVIADKKRFESEAEKNTRPTGASSPFSPSSPPPPHPHRDQSGATTKNQRDTSFSTGQAPREDGFHGEDGEDGEDVSPSPEISPEKINVPPTGGASPTPARNAPLPATASSDNKERF